MHNDHSRNEQRSYEQYIRMSRLRQLDLNLLVAFQALMQTRSVTRAAGQLNITQSAMSRTLQRLRTQLNDPLFLRGKDGLIPTVNAEMMADGIDKALSDIEHAINLPDFQPGQSDEEFTLMISSFMSQIFLPSLLNRLHQQAPGMHFECVSRVPDFMQQLESGRIDLAITTLDKTTHADIYAHPLAEDSLVTVMRHDHPLASQPLTVTEFCAAQHVQLTLGKDRHNSIDEQLEQQGLSRNVVIRTPHFTSAPYLVAQSDLLLTMPSMLASRMSKPLNLAIRTPPVSVPPHTYNLIWHTRQHNNRAHRWLREQVIDSITQQIRQPMTPGEAV